MCDFCNEHLGDYERECGVYIEGWKWKMKLDILCIGVKIVKIKKG